MDSSMYTQWVQSPIQESPQHEGSEWPKDRTTTANPSSPTLDISDFASLGDLAGPSTSSLLSTNSQPFYNPYGTYYMQSPYNTMAYGAPWPTPVPLSNYSSLNGATTSSSTQQSPQQQHVQPQQQQQQQQQQSQQQSHPPTPQHMMIDPVLTMNGNGTSPSAMQTSFSHSSPFPAPPSQQQQQQQQPQDQAQQQQRQSQPQYYNINQHILYPSPYYRQQQQSAPQGTLSPQALHSPTNSMMAIMPSSFYSHQTQSQSQLQPGPSHQQQQPQPQQTIQLQQPQPQLAINPLASTSQATEQQPPQGPTPEERKRQFQTAIRPLLQPSAFTGAQAVNQLTNHIADYGVSEVDAAQRLEILARIRDGAGNHYYRAWSENATAIDITREWIKAAAKGNNAALVETTMPLLHLIDRLPFTVDSLMSSKLGKVIKKLVKDEPSPAIKDMASNLERRWRNMISDVEGGGKTPSAQENTGMEDPKTKKRKLNDPVPARPSSGQATKKSAVGTASSTKPTGVVKKEVVSSSLSTSTSSTSKDAKADSGFFSQPKKAKLPSFKKAALSLPSAVPGKKDEPPLLPGSFNAFQDVMKTLNLKPTRKDSPASVSTPPPGSSTSTTTPSLNSNSGLTKDGKKRKSVTWAPDGKLESVKLIERAIYDDDDVNGTHVGPSLRDLDRGEGAALHAHLFEEVLDWMEPILVEHPPEPENGPPRTTRGGNSEEKTTQEEREQTALGALYMTPNQIPDSPAEPAVVLSEEETDKDAQQMTCGPECDAIFWSADVPPAVAASSVADLVGQLGMGMMDTAGSGGLDMGSALAAVQNLPQEQLQQLLLQLQVPTTAAAAQFGTATPYGAAAGGSDGSSWADYGQSGGYQGQDQDDTSHPRWSEGNTRGRGGRGRGRGRGRGDDGGFKPYNIKRKPCSFFAAGRCKYGDLCDFAHDLPPA